MTSSWPTMILRSSVRICSRPDVHPVGKRDVVRRIEIDDVADHGTCHVSLIGGGSGQSNGFAATRLPPRESRASSAPGRSPAVSSSRCSFAGGMLSFSSRSASTRRSSSRRSRYSARSFGSAGSGVASPTEPSDSDRRHLAVLAGRRRVLAALPCRRCRRAARARWRAALRARRPRPTSALAYWNASSTLMRLFLSASAASAVSASTK